MKKTKFLAAAAIAAAGTLITTHAASAAPGDLVVTAGTLDFDPAGAPTLGTFAPVTLNGNPQLTRLQIAPFTIIDARGTSAGWTVTLNTTVLTNGASTIALNQLSMSAATVIDNSTALAAASVTGTAIAAGTGTDVFVTATAAVTSNGTFFVSPKPLKLVVPANALAGTYTTTATVTVA